mgnify:FL=1
MRLRKINCLKYIDGKRIKEKVLHKINNNNVDKSKKEIKLLEQDIIRINEVLDNIYLDKLNKVINNDQFNRVKVKLENELNIKQDRLLKLVEYSNYTCNKVEQNKKIDDLIDDFLSMKNPSRELIVGLVDRVNIYKDKKIDVKVSFKITIGTNV